MISQTIRRGRFNSIIIGVGMTFSILAIFLAELDLIHSQFSWTQFDVGDKIDFAVVIGSVLGNGVWLMSMRQYATASSDIFTTSSDIFTTSSDIFTDAVFLNPVAPAGFIAYIVPKPGEKAVSCDDAFAFDVQRGIFAVADGVGTSFLSRPWASILVQGFVKNPYAFAKRGYFQTVASQSYPEMAHMGRESLGSLYPCSSSAS